MEQDALYEALGRFFGHTEFRAGQREVIEQVLGGRDALAVMPTGGGKSLCYQLPALVHEGVTLVISPLIALMQDQVDALVARRRLPATALNSTLTASEMSARLRGLGDGQYRLVYVAPERFRSPRFLEAARRAGVWLFAVDEAHCVSMWGHDFRPDYLQLAPAIEALGGPQVLALTATATPEVREDIVTQLRLGQAPRTAPEVVVRGFARPTLTLAVTRCRTRQQKAARLLALLEEYPTAIVYAATRKNVEWVSATLVAAGIRAGAYHAGLPDGVRRGAQERFLSGALDVVAATNAFGMGIDRADVRAIVHWDVPGSLEAYYQEAGRAGRDGEPARCELLFSEADVRTQEFFLEGGNPPLELVLAVARAVREAGAEGVSAAGVAATLSEGRASVSMGVETALGALGRWEALTRMPGEQARWRAGPARERPTEEDLAHLADKARRDRARLDRMLRYARGTKCRHATILGYFGEEVGDKVCLDRCDRCLAGRRQEHLEGEPLAEGEWAAVQKALSAVARLRGRFGRQRVVQVLAGSRDRKVRQAGLDRLPTYGALAVLKQERIHELLDALEGAGCLETVGDEYPKMALTSFGAQVMRREMEVRIDWRLAAPPRPDRMPRGGRTGGGQGGGQGGDSGSTGEGAGSETDEVPVDEGLYEALRAWRTEEARRQGVPAYVVFPNRTLEAIARERPTTRDDLLAVKGVGPARLASHGAAVLALLSSY